MNLRKKQGITLITLVITIIVMLILATVSISTITNTNSILDKTKEVANRYNSVSTDETDKINSIIAQINALTNSDTSMANKPILLEGMKPVNFNLDGTTNKINENVTTWYDYSKRQWANAETKDGSLWVWIPRFAYKIIYYNDESKSSIKGKRDVEGYKNASGITVTNTGNETVDGLDTIGAEVKSSYGDIDIVFLNGVGNQYYKKVNGNLVLVNAIDDGYIIHPAFKNGMGNYSNGEWIEEISGFWMAKFQAGFQYGDASLGPNQKEGKDIVMSSVKYTKEEVYISAFESSSNTSGWATARNYLYGNYGSSYPYISYPVFKGNQYAMNYITAEECYNLSRVLNEAGNIYGLSTMDSDTHQTKNSEWGAVAYLGYSQYGLNGEKIHINKKTLDNSVTSVYAVTGYAIENIEGGGALFPWYTKIGQTGSNNGNMTGVYDMSGATWERTSGHIANGNTHIELYGKSYLSAKVSNDVEAESTQYATLYRHNPTYDNINISINANVRSTASANNYKQNYDKYGDAIYETSTFGAWQYTTSGFNHELTRFSYLNAPFIVRGGDWSDVSAAGPFAFAETQGRPDCNTGFRAVILPK